MKSKILQCVLLLALGILLSTSVKAQNMSRYITLTVTNGENISLRFAADADNTPVSIVSGDQVYNMTVGTNWTYYTNYTAGATTMTIYGDLLKFNCSQNGSKVSGLDVSNNTALTALYCQNNQLTSLNVSGCTALKYFNCHSNQLISLDVSKNTALKKLYCYGNLFNTNAVDELFCTLPEKETYDNAKVYILNNASDANYADVIASDKQNAIDKNWNVWYYDNNWNGALHNTDIPETTGDYECPPLPNMYRYITLTVTEGQNISLDLWADADSTLVSIVSGDQEYNITVDANWTGATDYTSGATTMTIYGDVLQFSCSQNGAKVSSLDASNNTNLEKIDCFNNQLISLDVSQNTALTDLRCQNNQLTSLDVSNNTALEKLCCYGNLFNTNAVDELFCTLPERATSDDAKIYILNNTSDANYADVIASNKQNAIDKNWNVWYYDNNNDDLYNDDIPETTGDFNCDFLNVNMSRYITLMVTEGQNISLNLWADANDTPVKIVSGVQEYNIIIGTSWTGSTDYTAGTTTMTIYGDVLKFNCAQNGANISSLDASHNTDLEWLSCQTNQLTSLNVSQNTDLEYFNCESNGLTSLDVSNNTALTDLKCQNNQFSDLDVSQNTGLKSLDCSYNQLISLDVSNNTDLTDLRCQNNQFSDLDVSNNTDLEWLSCQTNQLNSLNVSQNTDLKWLSCQTNQLNSLNVSNNTDLEKLYCYGNLFNTNAVNELFCTLPERATSDDAKIYILNNTSDANYADVIASNKQNAIDKNWNVWYYDDYSGTLHDTDIPETTGDLNCDDLEPNMNHYITLTVTNGQDITLWFMADADNTPIRIVSGIQEYNIISTSWTGPINYTAGTTTMTIYGDVLKFNCAQNGANISSLDASHNTGLEWLSCQTNQLTSLNVSQNTALEYFNCQSNDLTNLDVSNNTALKYFNCQSNDLTSLDVSNNTALKYFNCQSNDLTSLDVSNNTALEWLSCLGNNLTSLDVSGCTALKYFNCRSNQLISLDVSQNTALERLYCFNNQLTSLDVSNNTALEYFNCQSNDLTSLDVSNNTALEYFNCQSNDLTSLDVSSCTALKYFNCRSNQLISLDVSQNTALEELYCFGNLFNTNAVDELFCTLPEKETYDNAKIYILNNASDANYADVIASNKQNAINKHWHVWYYWNGTFHNINIPETTGDYDCTTGIADIEHANIEVYPNPIKAQLHIQSDTELTKIELYNAQGNLVQQYTHTTSIDVSSLSNGVYMLKLFTETGVYRTKIVKN